MTAMNDLKRDRLNLSGYTGSLNDAEVAWLRDATGWLSGEDTNLNDLWHRFLTGLGYSGQLSDMKHQYFSSLFPPEDDQHRNDLEFAFWAVESPLPGPVQDDAPETRDS